MGGTALWFKVPLQDLSSQDLNEVMKETSFVSGEVIAYADSLLYTNFNIYDENNHNLLLKKNLLADKEVLLLDTIYIELLNTINSDSMISLGIIDVNYEKGSLDILVTEKFHYPNGRAGSASCRKAIYSKI